MVVWAALAQDGEKLLKKGRLGNDQKKGVLGNKSR